MIGIICGGAGEGKTTVGVAILHDFIHHHGDYEIVTNTPLKADLFHARIKIGFLKYQTVKTKIIYVKTKEEWYQTLRTSTHAVHFIDEGGVWCNAYNFKIIPDEVYEKLNQVRHNELHLLVTCKKFKHVYTRLRENADAVIEVTRFPQTKVTQLAEPTKPWFISYDYYDTDLYDIEGSRADEEIKKRYRLGRRWLFNMRNVMDSFDTKYNISYLGKR
jgi:hypothetical protein